MKTCGFRSLLTFPYLLRWGTFLTEITTLLWIHPVDFLNPSRRKPQITKELATLASTPAVVSSIAVLHLRQRCAERPPLQPYLLHLTESSCLRKLLRRRLFQCWCVLQFSPTAASVSPSHCSPLIDWVFGKAML